MTIGLYLFAFAAWPTVVLQHCTWLSLLANGHHDVAVVGMLWVFTVTFLQISRKTQHRSWTWLYHQKANKMTFPTISCLYGNIVNFSHSTRIHFSANNTSFCWRLDWVCTHRHIHRQTKVITVYLPVSFRSLGGYNKSFWKCFPSQSLGYNTTYSQKLKSQVSSLEMEKALFL